MATETIWLQRPGEDVPWGFRLQGGRDQNLPLTVQTVSTGSIASTGLDVGDEVLSIGDIDTTFLTHAQAQQIVKTSGNLLQLHISKRGAFSPGYSEPSGFVGSGGTTMDAQGGVHDLFSDMYRHSGGVTRGPPVQSAPQAHYGQYQPQTPQDTLYPHSGYGYKSNEPSSPGTMGGLFSAAGLSEQPSEPRYYGAGSYKNGHTNDNAEYRFGRPIESAGTAAPYAGPSSGYQTYGGDRQVSTSGPGYDPYSHNSSHDTEYVVDPYTHSGGGQTNDYGNFMGPMGGDGSVPDPPSYASLSSQYSNHTTAPNMQGQNYQDAQQTYQYSVSSPDREDPSLTYKTTNPQMSYAEPTYPYNQSVSSSSVSELSEVSSVPATGYAPPTWDDELTSTWSTGPPPSDPPPPVPTEAPLVDNSTDATAHGYSDPYIPAPPPLPLSSTSPGGPPPVAPPPPPPLPTSKPPGFKNSTGTQIQDKNEEQWSTRLDEQLASMNLNDGHPYSGGSGGVYSPSRGPGPAGPLFPTSPTSPYDRQLSYGSTHSNSSGPPGLPDVGSPVSGPGSPIGQGPTQKATAQPAMPDAVLNMAARGPPEKKPWTYGPDIGSIIDHGKKVKRKTPSSSLPKYQNILNLPSFDDAPPHVVPKKGSSVPSTPSAADVVGDPLANVPSEGGFVKHAQFNSPLQLYSDTNAAEALESQSGGMVAAYKPQTSVGGKDITQSATYKMIHGLDEPSKPKHHPVYGEGPTPKAVRQPSHDDEIKFSGVNRPSDIPSKSFRHLQNMTVRGAQGEVDDSPIRANISGDDPEDIGGYDEASIRYMGRKIPSKSFQLLQSMTGGPAPEDTVPKRGGPRRTPQRSTPQRSTPQREGKANPDDGVDISYVGGNIPSKSFQYLQQSISHPGQNSSAGIESDEGIGPESSTPSTPRSGSSDKYLAPNTMPPQGMSTTQAQAALARRRRRRPQRSASAETLDEPDNVPRNWDEGAYLSGRVPLISERDYTPTPSRGRSRELSVPRPDEYDHKSPFEDKDFDEDAFLKGKIAIFNEAPQERPAKDTDFKWKPEWLGIDKERRRKVSKKAQKMGVDDYEYIYSLEKKDNHPDREADRPELTVPFDEKDFLEGKIAVLGGEAKPRDPVEKEEVKPIWQESAEKKQQAFTEQNLDPLQQPKVIETECEWREAAEKKKQNLTDDKLQILAQPKDKREQTPEWAETAVKKQEVVKEQLEVLGKGKDKDDSTPEWAETAERKKQVVKKRMPRLEKAIVEPEKDGDRPELTVPFDEDEFLQGKIPLLGGEAKPREPVVKEKAKPIWHESAERKKRTLREKSHLQKMEKPKEDYEVKEGDRPELSVPFDEDEFLQGKIAMLGGEVKPREPIEKEVVKPVWQDSAEKKKQAFTDMYLEAMSKPKEADESIPVWKDAAERKQEYVQEQLDTLNRGKDKDETVPEWKDAAEKKQEIVKEQLDTLNRGKERVTQSPEWAAKLAERSGEEIVHKVQQQKELSGAGNQSRQKNEPVPDVLLNKIRQAREQTPADQEEKPEWLVKAEHRRPLENEDVVAVTARSTYSRRSDDDDGEDRRHFNEEEFLAGNVPLLRGASDPSMRLPPRDPRKKMLKERAPWQRDADESMTDDEFDERVYLKGRLPLARQQSGEIPQKHDFAKIPSRTFNFLRRSVSREPGKEGSPHMSGYASDSDAASALHAMRRASLPGNFSRARSNSKERFLGGPGKDPYTDLVYVGKKIPSKTFLAMQRKIDEEPKNTLKAYFEKEMLKRQQSQESKENKDEGIDVDDAIEKLEITDHNPQKYLDILKKSVEGEPNPAVKAEMDNDVTDF